MRENSARRGVSMKVGGVRGAFKIIQRGSYLALGKCMNCGHEDWTSPYKKSWTCKNCGYKGGVENKVDSPTKGGEEY